jgi:hypothetical protein
VVQYRWHPLHGQRVRRIQSERRASGELVHVELTPGAVTILPAWKLDAIYCAGLKVGAPQVSLAALRTLRELLASLFSFAIFLDSTKRIFPDSGVPYPLVSTVGFAIFAI